MMFEELRLICVIQFSEDYETGKSSLIQNGYNFTFALESNQHLIGKLDCGDATLIPGELYRVHILVPKSHHEKAKQLKPGQDLQMIEGPRQVGVAKFENYGVPNVRSEPIRRCKSEVCNKFYLRINSEIAAGSYGLDSVIKSLLEKHTNMTGTNLSMLPMFMNAIQKQPSMRFIYGMTLFEAFIKEYIQEKSNTDLQGAKDIVNSHKSAWSQKVITDGNAIGTPSLLNIQYSNFILQNEYGINVTLRPAFQWEYGAIRDSLVHHNGYVGNQSILERIPKLQDYFKVSYSIGDEIDVMDRVIKKSPEFFRSFIRQCDYE